MKKQIAVLILMLSAVVCGAQTTAVTATITDSDTTVWINAGWNIQFVPAPNYPNLNQYTINGVSLISNTYNSYLNQTGTASGAGVITVTLLDNNQISPRGSTWRFIVQSQTSAPATSYTPTLVTGASESLTTYLSSNSIAPRFPAASANTAFGYADVEVTPTPQPGGMYYNVVSNANRIWNGASWSAASGGAGVTSSIFYITNNCGGLSNCLTWVDDDSTDNCSTATTNFFTSINSYAGPGAAQVYIQGSGSGKAYKLVACSLPLVGPSGTGGLAGSIIVNSNATIDCAQTSGSNCIQMGKTGCSTSSFYGTGCHDVTWRGGTIVGCVNLTSACMEVEQGMYINIIDDVNFVNTGAGNATIGNCTNYSVLWHTFIGGQEFSRNRYWGNVAGQCFSVNNDTTGGANTIIFTNNILSHAPGASCGSIAHYDSSAHSTIDNNTIYGWSSNITLASNGTGSGGYSGDGGWMISGNDFDYSAGCSGAGGIQAEIQFSGGTNNVGPATIINNNVQSSPFINQAFGAGVSPIGWTVLGNTTYYASLVSLIGGAVTNCFPFGSGGGNVTSPCVFGANPGFLQSNASGSANSGWMVLQGNNGHVYSGTCPGAAACATNNVTSTAINGTITLTTGLYEVKCQVILTRAATTSSTLPSCVVSWTDLLTNAAESATVTATSAANTLGTQVNGTTGNIGIANASNVNVTTTGYATSGATSMQYGVFADIMKVY
jgi:hypothetical protein